MSNPEGLRMGGAADVELLNDTIVRLTLAMSVAVPSGTVDHGTIAHALMEMAAQAVATAFPKDEQGAVVEHLQNYFMQSVEQWSTDPARVAMLKRAQEGFRG